MKFLLSVALSGATICFIALVSGLYLDLAIWGWETGRSLLN